MKTKLLILSSCALLLASCHSLRETSSQYERLPIKVAKNPTKEGKACYELFTLFSLFYSDGDISVETARKNGDINEIVSIESESSHSLFHHTKCTIVRGN